MAGLSLICLVAYTVVSGVVGVRLLMRASRSHGVPELLAGLAYIGPPALGSPMAIVASPLPRAGIAIPMYVLGEILLVSGRCCFLFFTVTVFRPNVRWATAMACVGSAVLIYSGYGVTHSFLAYDNAAEITEHARVPLAGMVGTLLLSYVWTGLEGLRYWRMMRKRLALGLAGPVVTNPFFLWTCSGLLPTAGISFSGILLALGENLARNPVNVTVTGLAGLANSVLLVLIFMPPAAYTRWIERSARAPQLATV